MARQRGDYLIDDRVGLGVELGIGRILNRMGHEDARGLRQAQSLGLRLGGIDKHVRSDHYGRLPINLKPD